MLLLDLQHAIEKIGQLETRIIVLEKVISTIESSCIYQGDHHTGNIDYIIGVITDLRIDDEDVKKKNHG